MGSIIGAALCFQAAAGEPTGAPADRPLLPLANVELAPALKAAAEREHIVLFKTTGVSETASTGDSEVFWVGAVSGKRRSQWLVQFSRGVTTPAEQKANRTNDVTRYLSWGPVEVFKSEVAALDIWIAGPVDTSNGPDSKDKASAPVRVRKARLYVPRDFLRLGLDDSERAASLINRRMREVSKEDPQVNFGHIYSMAEPIKPENIAYAKPVAARLELTAELERAWAGGIVALQAFYKLTEKVPELKEIGEIVFKKPAVWKLGKLAFGAQFKTNYGGMDRGFVDSGKLGFLPVPMASFDVPFSYQFENDLIVSGAMLVTKPAPPLDVGAGILSIIAYHPTDKTRAVQLMAIASAKGVANAGGTSDLR